MSALQISVAGTPKFIVIDANGKMKFLDDPSQMQPGDVLVQSGNRPIAADMDDLIGIDPGDESVSQIDFNKDIENFLALLEQGVDPTELGEDFAPAAGGQQGSAIGQSGVIERDGVSSLASTAFDTDGIGASALSTTQDLDFNRAISDVESVSNAVDVNGTQVDEGELAYFTVTLTSANTIDAQYTWSLTNGSAVLGDDYTSNISFNPESGVTLVDGLLNVPAGVSQFQVIVPTVEDDIHELTENFILTVGGQSGEAVIFDDDPPPSIISIELTNEGGVVPEGDPAYFKITISGDETSTPTQFSWLLSGTSGDDSAQPEDYADSISLTEDAINQGVTIVDGKLVVPPGVTEFTVAVDTIDDTEYEAPEKFQLEVGNEDTGYKSAEATIIDNEGFQDGDEHVSLYENADTHVDSLFNGTVSVTDDLHVVRFSVAVDGGDPVQYVFNGPESDPIEVILDEAGTLTIWPNGNYSFVPLEELPGDPLPDEPREDPTIVINYTASDGTSDWARVDNSTLTINVQDFIDYDETINSWESTHVQEGTLLANSDSIDGKEPILVSFTVSGTDYVFDEFNQEYTVEIENIGTLTVYQDGNYIFDPIGDWTDPDNLNPIDQDQSIDVTYKVAADSGEYQPGDESTLTINVNNFDIISEGDKRDIVNVEDGVINWVQRPNNDKIANIPYGSHEDDPDLGMVVALGAKGDYVEGGSLNDVIFLGTSAERGGGDPVNQAAATLEEFAYAPEDPDVLRSGGIVANTNNDNIDVAFGEGGDDIIFGQIDTSLIAGEEGNDTLYGSLANDAIRGGSGDDQIWGYEGDDYIVGGTGNDILTGGEGVDVFIWSSADIDNSEDVITDFSMDEGDKLDLTDLLADDATEADVRAYLGSTGEEAFSVNGDGNLVLELTNGGMNTTIEFEGYGSGDADPLLDYIVAQNSVPVD